MTENRNVLHYFNAPPSCHLGKRVYKRLFYENAKLRAYDKKILKEDVVVAEEVRLSDWIDLSGPSAVQAEFLKSIDVTGWSYTNFRTFYNSFVHRLLALESTAYTGSFSLDNGMSREERSSLLGECRQIEAHIKNEDHFNRQVEINATIKELERLLEELVARL